MCITLFCLQPSTNSQVKLVLGFNREEQTERQTLPLAPFEEDKNIYAGRDVLSGGTWLGLNVETGILVILTNFWYEHPRFGHSRGQLVYSYLKTDFIPQQKRGQTDKILQESMTELAKSSSEYSPFNLTVCNLRTRKTFYVCSQRQPSKNVPVEFKIGETHGVCNSDIDVVWQKTSLGINLFKLFVSKLGYLNKEDMFERMLTIFHNKIKFEGDESEIFVQPFFDEIEQAQRRTKQTFQLVMLELEEYYELTIKEITYKGKNMKEETVVFNLKMTK